MKLFRNIVCLVSWLVLLASCSSTKNTAGTRLYHSFNTRYNVFFNGNMAFEEAFKAQQENYKENYSEMIRMFPVSSLPKDKSDTGGPFDRAIEKGVKAIKTHSIQTKPEKRQGKRNDPKYQEWMNRTEYNPFLHNAWILMAKAQFHNGDFMQAASSFAYIARLYASQPEIALNAKIWQARCYAEIDWFYEADDILSKIKKENLSKRLQDWYATVQADFLIKQKQYSEAVPYLKTAIRAEKDKLQKNRQKFLLGQIYGSLGEKSLAYKMFGEIASSSVTYPLMFGAKVRQTEVYAGNDTAKITGELRKMARSSKNKEYLDQIYYALGNVYMTIPDTAKAIASYELGVEKSTQKGIDKALNQIKLGDIYFERRKYVQAQPNYSEALTQLKKGDDAYPRVSKRSEILDELVNHIEAVELQDSLLRLSQMSEDEQMEVINQIIANLKKKEAEEKKKQEREDYLAQQEDLRAELNTNRPRPVAPVMPPSDEGLFYFYSPQVVALGKNTFQQKWGRRKLEDDWRRRNKNNPMQDIFDDEDRAEMEKKIPDTKMETGENMSSAEKMAETSSDPHDPQFYLQQIPASEEDIEEANLIIANGLFNMALIYKDLLEDIPLALETFDQLISRFPENENKLLAYYHIFLIYLKEENTDMTRRYKQIIRAEFPESEYAIAMADPNYEYNLRMMNVVQDSLYRDTYQAYLEGNVDAIRTNYQIVTTKYNQSKLLPKFSFLNALSYVQTNDADKFKELLKELINKFPKADVSVLAAEMMKGFQRGLLLSASGDNLLARGNLFNIRFGASEGELSEDIAALEFSMETDTPYELLLMYPQGAVNDNLLLYMVAHFNFGNFVINDFDLEKTSSDKIGMLHIKGFNNFDEILQYLRIIDSPEGYASKLEQPVVIVPVSLENYDILMRGKSLEEYMTFFEKNFGENYPSLIERWNLNREETFEPLAGELDTAVSDDELSEEKTMETTEIQPIPPVTVLSEQGTAAVPSPAVSEEDQQKTSEWEEKISSTYDQASGVVEDINTTLNEILSDPIRGIQNLFKRKKSSNAIDEYAKQQEKEEKERQKQLKKEKEEKDKALQEQARQKEKEKQELLKRQQEEEKNLLKEKKKQEEELVKQKKQEEKAKEDEKKRIQKEKEDARKQKEKERKEIQKKKEQERKAKEKAREEARKQKEKERKEIQKKKEQERKAKANARKKQSR